MKPVFVLAWVTPSFTSPSSQGFLTPTVFVEHPTRGWEIPGGHLEEDETPEQAVHRELLEETGLHGRIHCWNKTYYPEGWVAHIIVDDKVTQETWQVDDASVSSIRWWTEIPPVKLWTVEEFQDLHAYFEGCQSNFR
ncbi:MAG: NUDIX domain-containing protein [Candidatus Poseidoniales archaeon]|jgi:8-oxo-dGTP pyrophosphatase MutT (NUDIX family)